MTVRNAILFTNIISISRCTPLYSLFTSGGMSFTTFSCVSIFLYERCFSVSVIPCFYTIFCLLYGCLICYIDIFLVHCIILPSRVLRPKGIPAFLEPPYRGYTFAVRFWEHCRSFFYEAKQSLIFFPCQFSVHNSTSCSLLYRIVGTFRPCRIHILCCQCWCPSLLWIRLQSSLRIESWSPRSRCNSNRPLTVIGNPVSSSVIQACLLVDWLPRMLLCKAYLIL